VGAGILIASLVLAAVVLLAGAVAARSLISRAQRPAAQMTDQAAELDRLAASLRREQRFSAELSHELRAPLAHLMSDAQFALRHGHGADEYRAGFEQVLQNARQMSRTLEALTAAARAELDPQRATSDATACARVAIGVHLGLAARRHIEITLDDRGGGARVAAEADLVERMLAPVLENACHYASGAVRVVIECDRNTVIYRVEDDGPGVPADDRETIFESGRRSTSRGSHTIATQGAGLGLALARRLVRSAGGDVEALESDEGGRFVVRLPAT
jgi:two-component system, OmpR family, sensor kinase